MQHDCMLETGATDEMMSRAFHGHFPDVPEFKEQLVCMGRKGGVISPDGTYHIEILKQKILPFIEDEPLLNFILEDCYHPELTPQETAFRMAKCVYVRLMEE